MSLASFVPLVSRGVLRIEGPDARSFLQGLVSNDVSAVGPGRAVWAAFLTAQGRYLHDFFICESEGALLLETEADRLPDLKRRLSMYRLRSRVSLEEIGSLGVWALIGEEAASQAGLEHAGAGSAAPLAGGIVFVDPRLSAAGLRALLPAETSEAALVARGFTAAEPAAYDALRIPLGLPDGSRDMLVEKSLLLECGFDELGGIDWDKGCYLGQELTARTRWRGLVKRRLLPMRVDGLLPAPGTPISINGQTVGEVRSGTDGWVLALLRLSALPVISGAGGVSVGEATLVPRIPEWAALPADVAAGDAQP
jgi:folate-binding protein YgfZ